MNLPFLILIAIPLGVYLCVLLMSTFRAGETEQYAELVDVGVRAPELETDAVMPSTRVASSPEGNSSRGTAAVLGAGQGDSATAAASEELVPVPEAALANEMQVAEEAPPEMIAPPLSTEAPSLATESSAEAVLVAEPPDATDVMQESTAVAPLEARLTDTEAKESGDAPLADKLTLAATENVSPETTKGDKPEITTNGPEEDQPVTPEGPVVLPPKDTPKYAFDYRGRLWVEKKNRGFFRQLRRPQLPPDDPQSRADR